MSARDFWEQLKTKRWAGIKELVDAKEEESFWLDFKERPPTMSPKLDDYDRDVLARALSAFANTNGGVLIYGVSVKSGEKKPGDPDRAEGIVPIPSIGQFRTQLEQATRTYVEPAIAGVDVVQFEDPADPSSGVAVVFVPQSDGGPHRACRTKTKADDRYYMRTATSCEALPHPLLAAMFGRLPSPSLRLEARLSGSGRDMTLRLALRNEGRGIAREPAVMFEGVSSSDLRWEAMRGNFNSPDWLGYQVYEPPNSNGVLVQGLPTAIIYPQMSRYIIELGGGSQPALVRKLRLRGTIYSAEMQPVPFDEELQPGEFAILPRNP